MVVRACASGSADRDESKVNLECHSITNIIPLNYLSTKSGYITGQ